MSDLDEHIAPEGDTTLVEPISHEGYRVVIERSAKPVRVIFRGEAIAESERTLVMHETRLPSVFYFPREDVRLDLLVRSNRRTNCPFKGNATYFNITLGEEVAENAAWSYENPFDESSMVKDHIAFDWFAVGPWLVGETELAEPPHHEIPDKDNPLVDWLIRQAWRAKSTEDLVAQLAAGLLAADVPLWRLKLLVRTLNPQLFALTYTWQRNKDEVTVWQASHKGVQSAQYLDSPFTPIIKGEGGVRRRLDGPHPRLDFPILEDLVKEGATDYVAMPLYFSDGQINIITLASDRPGGFSTEELGQLHEILPNLSRLLEAHARQVNSLSLLRTYLGRNAGERVINGQVKRGDGEELHAAIWFSDLRDSTALADSLAMDDYLATLNHYFDCTGGAVIKAGGEILKFIGDAVLAIFPIDDPTEPTPEACGQALSAAREARRRIEAINKDRSKRGETPLAFGIGLHRGNLTYGNIGTEQRLDFTVIGPAVNEAARIEAQCKALGQTVVTSGAFADSVPGALTSLGRHTLRGVRAEQELFTDPQ